MQIKLSETLLARFAGKSSDEIMAALETATAPAPTPAATPVAPPAAPAAPAPAANVLVVDFNALVERVNGLEASVAKVAVDAKAEASRAVATAIAGTGLSAPVAAGTPAEPLTPPAAPAKLDFAATVKAAIAGGASKADAITAAIKADPDGYNAWLQKGGQAHF